MYRSLSFLFLLAAIYHASEASALVFPAMPVTSQGAASSAAGTPNLLPPSAIQSTQSAMPVMSSPHVPVYQTFILPPPKPPKPSPIYVPDSQNTSRRRHLGW
jgi:hypothetical protein